MARFADDDDADGGRLVRLGGEDHDDEPDGADEPDDDDEDEDDDEDSEIEAREEELVEA